MKLNIVKNTLVSAEQEPDDRELIVPDGVKTIADEGLAHLPLIEKIVLPCSVRSIGYHALFGDVNLRELTFPLTASLKDGALMIVRPAVGAADRMPLEKLTLTVPEDKGDVVVSRAFSKRLYYAGISPRHVVFGPGLEQIASEEFPYFFKETQTLEFGKGLKAIGVDNFKAMNSLTRIIFPGTLEFVGDNSFQGCANLHEVTLPEKCKICRDAFKGCGAKRDGKKLAAPEFSVTRYQPAAAEIEPDGPIETLTLPGVEMKVSGDRLLSTTAADSVREITVPQGIRVIEEEGLAHLPRVKKITLPGSVERILSYAFEGDVSLAELTFPATAKVAEKVIDGNIFYTRKWRDDRPNRSLKCVTLTMPKGKRLKTLNNETGYIFDRIDIDRLVFAPGIEAISKDGVPAFCTHAKTVIFGEGLRKIGEHNFHLSADIREIVFPSTLESIGGNSFCYIENLHEVHVPKNCDVSKFAFKKCGTREHGRDLRTPRFEIIRD